MISRVFLFFFFAMKYFKRYYGMWKSYRGKKLLFTCTNSYLSSPFTIFFLSSHRKDYPDYYEVITNPIDMKTINERIKSGNYKNVDQFISDARLMFNNCRQYNEEGSAIVKDANTLEKR